MTEEDTADEFDETVHLERGENLLEIHLGNARFSPEALGTLGDPDPSTFCTFAFYDYEIQSTAVVQGAHPAYNFTSQYLVRMDELLLQHLHTSTVAVETQLAEGLDYRTVAAGHLRLSQVLDRSGKVFGTLHLVGEYGYSLKILKSFSLSADSTHLILAMCIDWKVLKGKPRLSALWTTGSG